MLAGGAGIVNENLEVNGMDKDVQILALVRAIFFASACIECSTCMPFSSSDNARAVAV
jgi:hypothetical protein